MKRRGRMLSRINCNFGSFDENDREWIAQKREVRKGMGDEFEGTEFYVRSANWRASATWATTMISGSGADGDL
jgi:hypothetical protein